MPITRTPDYKIELAIPSSLPNKVRGDALENLMAEFLRQQSYSVVTNLRCTGTEIDLSAKHDISGRTVLIECKSQKGNIQSDAIDGLFTDAMLRDVDEAWLVTLAPMGSDAKGKFEEIQRLSKKPFIHIRPQQIVEHVIKSGYLADPSTFLVADAGFSKTVSLILTAEEAFFCLERISASGNSSSGHLLLDAKTLSPASGDASSVVEECIDAYSEGRWITLDQGEVAGTSNPLPQTVIDLVPGTDWKDYRPSRPEDFIGREDAIDELAAFVEDVRCSKTKTRIFGIKAASGWGKSSLVLKAAQRINGETGRVHVLAVDCRAAVSSDYPHLVLAKAFGEARLRGIEFWGLPSTLPVADNPFDNPQVADGLDTLRNSGGLVVIVFDQFEEIIHSPNRALFSKLESLCHQIDGLQLPILLGFSWRTDAMVSADNPGYNLWHRLSDRRHDIQLRAFTHSDAVTYLERVERSSGVRLAAKDRRFLLTTYVGLPWLLKKLSVYMVTNRLQGAEEGDDDEPIKQLFDRDLEGLTPEDHACVRAVAASAPVPIHSLSLNFPEKIISGLIERRLLISSGGQLSTYSDIFRDYVLYGRLPNIPNTYCPYLTVSKLVAAIKLIHSSEIVSYSELAAELKIALTSADNVARDLRQMGLVRLNRSGGLIYPNFETTQTATQRVVEFLRKHIILQTLDREGSQDRGAKFGEIVESAVKAYRFSVLSNSTIEQYCAQVLRLAGALGLIEKRSESFDWARPIRDITRDRPKPVRVMSRADGFMGQAPPRRVEELMLKLANGIRDRAQLIKMGLRNAIFAATSLGLVRTENGKVLVELDVRNVAEILAIAQDQEFVGFVRELLGREPSLGGAEVGQRLADAYDFELHPASLGRYGNALKQWVLLPAN